MNIAFFGGSFNPPHQGHINVIDHLLNDDMFDKVIVKPCGVRSDKPELKSNSTERSKLIEDMFRFDNKKFSLILDGVSEEFKSTYMEMNDLSNLSDNVWMVCGEDIFMDTGNGLNEMQEWWVNGNELFSQYKFYIFERNPDKKPLILPKNHIYAEKFEPLVISSSFLREGIDG